MNTLIHFFKALYAYCTDLVINLANLTGLSYYEVNFIIFIILYPLFLLGTPILYLYQKSRLRNFRRKAVSAAVTNRPSNPNAIKTLNKRVIFATANIAWIFVIFLGTFRVLIQSSDYYEQRLLNGDFPPEADSIGIPIFQGTFFAYVTLLVLLIFLNLFLVFTLRKAILPTRLFIQADFFSFPVIFWELFFGFWIVLSMLVCVLWWWMNYYIEGFVTLYFTFILVNLRAGQISRYTVAIPNTSQ